MTMMKSNALKWRDLSSKRCKATGFRVQDLLTSHRDRSQQLIIFQTIWAALSHSLKALWAWWNQELLPRRLRLSISRPCWVPLKRRTGGQSRVSGQQLLLQITRAQGWSLACLQGTNSTTIVVLILDRQLMGLIKLQVAVRTLEILLQRKAVRFPKCYQNVQLKTRSQRQWRSKAYPK